MFMICINYWCFRVLTWKVSSRLCAFKQDTINNYYIWQMNSHISSRRVCAFSNFFQHKSPKIIVDFQTRLTSQRTCIWKALEACSHQQGLWEAVMMRERWRERERETLFIKLHWQILASYRYIIHSSICVHKNSTVHTYSKSYRN